MSLTDSLSGFQTAQQRSIAILSARPALMRKQAQWQIRGNRYLRRFGGMRPGALVQADPDVQRLAAEFIERVAPVTAKAFGRRMVPVAEAAFELMPVQTGLTKSLQALEFGVGETTFTASLANRSPYVALINKGQTARDLIWDPGERAAEQIADDIADGLT